MPRDTLRYYEKIGLLPKTPRDRAGRRAFQTEDLPWIEFVKRLKDTGMPLVEIRRYADLRQRGRSTLKARYQLLKQHACVLEERIKVDRVNLDRLREKMAFYQQEMRRSKSS